MTKTIQHQTGITLIEVLITVLILAIGSLGIASMQIAGIKYASGAYGRSQATQLADDMANRLRNNRQEALNLAADGSFGTGSTYRIPTFLNTFTASKNCITAECNLTELAAYDKSSWLDEVSRALPSGRGQILLIDETNSNNVVQRIYSIAIQWRNASNSSDQDATAISEIQSVTYRVAL